ncbi:MAG: polyprenyl synthetase family protein [Lysobacteraceae bacterium]
MPTEGLLAAWRTRIEDVLDAALPDTDHSPQDLHRAMRHAVLAGGKRMRPLLVYAAGHVAGADAARLDAAAAAVELVHAYSLVHDDLPAMDDDALRRGQPTVHVAFDEATAILAGDALQALAFELVASADLAAETGIALLRTLAAAAGAGGMCGGQALDLAATGKGRARAADHAAGGDGGTQALQALERLHAMKTGALIRAAVRMGALAGGAPLPVLQQLDRFATDLGLAFQIRDDILDIEGDSAALGKTAGKDLAQDKTTFPALMGLPASRARLDALAADMDAALEDLGEATAPLRALGRLAVRRDH